jgi:hypothetical protein
MLNRMPGLSILRTDLALASDLSAGFYHTRAVYSKNQHSASEGTMAEATEKPSPGAFHISCAPSELVVESPHED